MTVKAVLFDMYGTLGVQIGHSTLEETFEAAGFGQYATPKIRSALATDHVDGQEHREQSASRDSYIEWAKSTRLAALAEAGADEITADRISDLYDQWNFEFHSKMSAYPETVGVLEQLRANGLRIAICSNWDWDIDLALDAMGLGEYVDVVFHSAQLGVRKPHPSFFSDVLTALGLAKQDVLFVGDSWQADVVGATNAGLRVVFVDRNGAGSQDESLSVEIVPDLTGVLELLSRGSLA